MPHRPTGSDVSPTCELKLFDAASYSLNALNAAQQSYDQATDRVEQLRRQLFAD